MLNSITSPLDGIRSPFGPRLGFSPSALFADGEVGTWYDVSPETTFTDTARTTNATIGDAVAGITDLSGNGYHATQSTAAARPILRQDAGGLYYLEFDGVDDFLVTPSIDFSASDEMSVFAGMRKVSDAATGIFLEFSLNAGLNNGTFSIQAPNGALPRYAFASRGTGSSFNPVNGFSAPTTNVVTGLAKISDDENIIRVDGTQEASIASDQGLGNYGNYPLYIGMRAGTSLPFNGHLYCLLTRGKTTSQTELAKTESYVAKRTGVTL